MLYLDNMKPIAFWPYTSVVTDRIMTVEYRHGDSVDALQRDLIGMFNAAGIPCRADNKIVFEFFNTNTGKCVYIGFYDNAMHVGDGFRTDEYNRNLKQRNAREARYNKVWLDYCIPNEREMKTYYVLSNEDGTILAVYGSAEYQSATAFGRNLKSQIGARVALHTISIQGKPAVGSSISMKGDITWL